MIAADTMDINNKITIIPIINAIGPHKGIKHHNHDKLIRLNNLKIHNNAVIIKIVFNIFIF